MEFVAVPLAIGVSLLWYLPCVRAQGTNRALQRNDYVKIALLYGFAYACLLIIATEILWDSLLWKSDGATLGQEIVSDFLRAALLEEFFKLTGFLLAKQRIRPARKIDYMLVAGLIGLMYGIVEKAVLGNAVGVIIGLAIPMHLLWQLNQGGHWWEYEQAKKANNADLARRELFMAVGVPFLLHGCWDCAMTLAAHGIAQEDVVAPQVLGGVLLAAALVLGVVYTVKTIKKVRRIAKEAPPCTAGDTAA